MKTSLSLCIGSVSASRWAPTQSTTPLIGWYRYDSITQSAGALTGWTDKTSAGNNLVVGSGAPIYSAVGNNGRPEARFVAGSSHILAKASNIVSAANYTLFLVRKLDTNNTNTILFGCANGTGGVVLEDRAGSNDVTHIARFDATGGVSNTTTYESIIVTCASGAAPALYKNGVLQTLSGGTATYTNPGGSAQITLGGWFNGATYANFASMRVQEAGVYSAALSSRDVSKLAGYLRRLHNLPGV